MSPVYIMHNKWTEFWQMHNLLLSQCVRRKRVFCMWKDDAFESCFSDNMPTPGPSHQSGVGMYNCCTLCIITFGISDHFYLMSVEQCDGSRPRSWRPQLCLGPYGNTMRPITRLSGRRSLELEDDPSIQHRSESVVGPPLPGTLD